MTGYSQSASPNIAEQLLGALNQIERESAASDQSIEQEKFTLAQRQTDSVLSTLDLLIEVFIPLPERIKALLSREQAILQGISQFESLPPTEGAIKKEGKEKLLLQQLKNLDDTQKTLYLLKQKIKELTAAASLEKKPNSPQGKILEEVQNLMAESHLLEAEVADLLEKMTLSAAKPKVVQSIKKIEEALKKFQGKSDQQGQNSSKNQKQDPPKQQDQKQKQDQGKQKKSEEGQKSASGQQEKQKMTPAQALKELSRLRKSADDELKRREKKYGALAVPGQIPVEKDW
ncbi:MAG: hypothetical protein COB67_12540 [SAR324 cluster bacterium]|uniref:Uncharacterized protein n=1 Tax=SAR324 cluster bacterium TaxID=2024889 RepID=A0A2A4SSC5_9DELT|nr:MAG: hypothetical protein COB67_12540 [SAR324 cluster bacterium]